MTNVKFWNFLPTGCRCSFVNTVFTESENQGNLTILYEEANSFFLIIDDFCAITMIDWQRCSRFCSFSAQSFQLLKYRQNQYFLILIMQVMPMIVTMIVTMVMVTMMTMMAVTITTTIRMIMMTIMIVVVLLLMIASTRINMSMTCIKKIISVIISS